MAISDLQQWLIESAAFHRCYEPLLIESVVSQFSSVERNNSPEIPEFRLEYLILCASLLSSSEKANCQDIALRIAQFVLQEQSLPSHAKDAAGVILERLNNSVSVALAEKKGCLEANLLSRLPLPLFGDTTSKRIEHTIYLNNNNMIEVNSFQKQFWTAANRFSEISVSAPTSAGKSFIIKQWLVETVRASRPNVIVYIVPTRALIHEVETDLREFFQECEISDINISSLPFSAYEISRAPKIFVFTQERFHLYMMNPNHAAADILIIDEAHKFSDGYRGVLLQQVVDFTQHKNPGVKIIYASPFASNPELLLDSSIRRSEHSKGIVKSENETVSQNLLWASQLPRNPKSWKIELCVNGNLRELGLITLENSPDRSLKRLVFVADKMGDPEGGNVIYVNSASEAEKASHLLFDLVGEDVDDCVDIKNLIELIKKTVHRHYVLAKVLLRGIAFHYGNMPLLIRLEIERLFKENKIQYLICTSTLLEGVNLPCKSLFARGPQKGRGNPMTPGDFWNLAGRAGRWGKEFQGNIICVDPNDSAVWKNGAPKKRVQQILQRKVVQVLQQPNELLEYISSSVSGELESRNSLLEYIFSYLVSAHAEYGAIDSLAWIEQMDSNNKGVLKDRIALAIDRINLPLNIIKRNPGVSPINMQILFEYFSAYEKPLAELIPTPPESEDAVAVYTKVFQRANRHLAANLGPSGRIYMLALLATKWMRGWPLAAIISSRINYLRTNDRYVDSKLPSVIRECMTDVEEFARFQAPKYLNCYMDVLRYHLSSIDQLDLISHLPDLNMLLELGVSQVTQMSLLSLGLSRTSAISISEFISSDDMRAEEVLVWLRYQEWETFDIPEIVKREVSKVLALYR